MPKKRLFFVVGEASGDLHASHLIKALVKQNRQMEFAGWGGDLMVAAGLNLKKHYSETAFMGVWNVIVNLKKILGFLKTCQQNILDYQPDALVLVDYGGFNLRIAKWAHQRGIRVFYYISPQVWASRPARAYKIKKYVEQLFCIFPFEPEFYKNYGVEATFVGHPLLEDTTQYQKNELELQQFVTKYGDPDAEKLIGLLPGSRKQELQKMLPVFVQLAQKLPQFTFYIMQAPSIGTDYYAGFIEKEMNVKLIKNQDFNFIKYLDAALVTSGTATLQVALHQVPQVVCYKTDPLLYNIAKRIIKVDYISIVNIVLNRPFLKELIQKDCNVDNLFKEIYVLLNQKEDTLRIRQGYKDLYTILTKGNASENTALAILKTLN